MRITLINELDDFNREVYGFNVFDFNIVFVEYSKEEKPKGKRTWKRTQWWDNYRLRDSTCQEPPLTFEIRQIALEKVSSYLKVLSWDEWKKSK